MASTSSTTATSQARPGHDELLRRYAIDVNPDTRRTLAAYRARSHRSRWWGVVGALIAGAAGLLGTTDNAAGLGLARLLIGYLVGSAAAEMLSPRRRAAGSVHAASLMTRHPDLLLPRWARVLPWLFLVPCLGAPLLLLGHHPSGVTRFHSHTGHGFSTAWWFSATTLVSIAAFAATGLVCWRLTLSWLARRRLPVDNPDAARLDLLTRAMSARAVSGSAAVLGMSLLGGLTLLSSEPLQSMACSIDGCHYLYAWHDRYHLIEDVGLLLLLGAVFLFWFCRLSLVDGPLLRAAVETSR
ncbi:MAG: hypothetical protein M3Z50_06730 [Actinomycetota bacterium]|nr:hypothetical protein [Actinomycetota bacterium]